MLKKAEAGAPVPALCLEHGISTATFYKWRSTFYGMASTPMGRLNELEEGTAYQFRRVIERDLGYLGIVDEETSNPPRMDRAKLESVILQVISHDVYFLKREAYVAEAQFRFIWLIDGVAGATIDLVVPEARQYCALWEDQGEWIAIDNVDNVK